MKNDEEHVTLQEVIERAWQMFDNLPEPRSAPTILVKQKKDQPSTSKTIPLSGHHKERSQQRIIVYMRKPNEIFNFLSQRIIVF